MWESHCREQFSFVVDKNDPSYACVQGELNETPVSLVNFNSMALSSLANPFNCRQILIFDKKKSQVVILSTTNEIVLINYALGTTETVLSQGILPVKVCQKTGYAQPSIKFFSHYLAIQVKSTSPRGWIDELFYYSYPDVKSENLTILEQS